MHFLPLVLLPLAAQAINIVSSNDDGWAEKNIRTLYDSLTAAGHQVVISGPAENQSGTGSRDEPPSNLTQPCEFNSCPPGRAYGHNASQPHWNYVNSYPVTSMKHGIQSLASNFFGGPPDLAVAGPNVGANIGLAVFLSGTVGATTYAANEAKIPAIAFSGMSGDALAWNESTPAYSKIYADLAAKVTDRVVAAGTPYLPADIWLNVNFPEVTDTSCTSVDDFQFVLTRILGAVPLVTPDDVETCGGKRLPSETSVILRDGCYASISVGTASDKKDANATMQAVVLDKLGELLACLPSD
ncbi:survival protein sure-like phosphatase/nucleotidase [Aspergillus ambiguus]|uniref:5'/3'-nucleotidase SurE n=1 Tax=Aspergillus ambiguus TaxID=176160 RepID=UPI003CCD5491